MRKSGTGLLVLVLLAAAMAPAADRPGEHGSAGPVGGKKVRLTGTLSGDGARLASDTGEQWKVSNPEAVRGLEGRRVSVRGYVGADEHAIQVVKVHPAPAETTYRANVYDAAFRR